AASASDGEAARGLSIDRPAPSANGLSSSRTVLAAFSKATEQCTKCPPATGADLNMAPDLNRAPGKSRSGSDPDWRVGLLPGPGCSSGDGTQRYRRGPGKGRATAADRHDRMHAT